MIDRVAKVPLSAKSMKLIGAGGSSAAYQATFAPSGVSVGLPRTPQPFRFAEQLSSEVVDNAGTELKDCRTTVEILVLGVNTVIYVAGKAVELGFLGERIGIVRRN